jgi:hypothetical protein
MAERHRSKDGVQETKDYLSDDDAPGGHGRDGGRLPRQIGTKDELKRAEKDRPGMTRVRKGDEEERNA